MQALQGGPQGTGETVVTHRGRGESPFPLPLMEDPTMLLRHATPARNLPSILRTGLLASKSQGKLAVVWLHSPVRTAWATLHTVKRHKGTIQSVVVLEVNVSRSQLGGTAKGYGTCPITYILIGSSGWLPSRNSRPVPSERRTTGMTDSPTDGAFPFALKGTHTGMPSNPKVDESLDMSDRLRDEPQSR